MANLREWISIAAIRLQDLHFSYEDLKILVPFLILLLLLIWLLYRIKLQVSRTVQDEIYKSFPFLKETADKLEKRIDLLKLELERIESRLKEFKNRG